MMKIETQVDYVCMYFALITLVGADWKKSQFFFNLIQTTEGGEKCVVFLF